MTSIVKIFPQRTNLQSPLKVDEKMQTFLSKIWMKKILIKGHIRKNRGARRAPSLKNRGARP